MKIICKPRGGGKTTEAIKLASETNSYLVCIDHKEQERVFQQSKEMGINIHYPITFNEFLEGRYYGKGVEGFIIDNVDLLVQMLSRGVPIKGLTL